METETKESPIKGALIYQPQGAAGEYAKWAINLYHGCSNGCTYCYNRRGVLSHVFGDKPELAAPIVKARDKYLNIYMKENNLTAHDAIPQKVIRDTTAVVALNIIAKDIKRIGEDVIREDGGIFFSFTCDPFDPDTDMDMLRMVVFIFLDHQIPVTILTKNIDWLGNGKWKVFLESDTYCPDEDFLRYLTIGFTITGNDKLEPGAPSTEERIEALRKLHDEYKIKTFVSLEPITDLAIALEVIKETSKITNEIRLGVQSPIKKDRYDPNEFTGFVVLVKIMARSLDCRFMVKESMYKQAETFEGDDRDACISKLDEIRKIYESKQTENDEK
jgi:DNA repair photolyase|nr:MAG TPA: DNA repair photolyase [Caudoviricetes sp.]